MDKFSVLISPNHRYLLVIGYLKENAPTNIPSVLQQLVANNLKQNDEFLTNKHVPDYIKYKDMQFTENKSMAYKIGGGQFDTSIILGRVMTTYNEYPNAKYQWILKIHTKNISTFARMHIGIKSVDCPKYKGLNLKYWETLYGTYLAGWDNDNDDFDEKRPFKVHNQDMVQLTIDMQNQCVSLSINNKQWGKFENVNLKTERWQLVAFLNEINEGIEMQQFEIKQ